VDKAAPEQPFLRIYSGFSLILSTIAPYSSVALTRQHIITLTAFKLWASSPTPGHRTVKLVVIIFPNKNKIGNVRTTLHCGAFV
jgi:hypothetical protein